MKLFIKNVIFLLFIYYITVLTVFAPKVFNDSFLCNNYYNQWTYKFTNPHTGTMAGMMVVHDYIFFFLLIIFITVCVYLYFSYLSASEFAISKNSYKELVFKEKEKLRNNIKAYIYNKEYNFTHHPLIEFIWTTVPAIILIFLAVPSFSLLYAIEEPLEPVFTVIITGNQWFWSYEYSDYILNKLFLNTTYDAYNENIEQVTPVDIEYGNITEMDLAMLRAKHIMREAGFGRLQYDSLMIPEDGLPFGYPRLLSTDNVLVLPAKTPVRLLITSNDVIHSWAVPNFGIKTDAIPGRLNQTFFYTEFLGSSWGQCSELCGVNHAYMPIEVRVLPLKEFLMYINIKLMDIFMEHWKRASHFSFPYTDLGAIKSKFEVLLFNLNNFIYLFSEVSHKK